MDDNVYLPWVYADEIPQHFIRVRYEQYIAYGVTDVNVFLPKLMRFHHKKGVNSILTILLTS